MTSAQPLENADSGANQAPVPGEFPLRAVLILAPDTSVADSILHALQRRRACRLLAWVQHTDAAVRRLASERFDLVVVAGLGPELALAAVKRLRACIGAARILVAVQQIPAPVQVNEFVHAGAGGLIDCANGFADLPAAGQVIAHGHSIFPRRRSPDVPPLPDLIVGPEELTERERQVLERVATGMTSQQVADDLYLSVHTIEKYLSVCYRKLQAVNRVQACNVARYYGLI